MKSHPILYKPTMAQSVHDDLKSMTRRIIKPQPKKYLIRSDAFGCWFDNASESEYDMRKVTCPWAIGDLLWVKEEHYAFGTWWRNGYTEKGREKWKFEDKTSSANPICFPNNLPEKVCKLKHKGVEDGYYKRNSLFMPKRHCRTRTVIKDIKAERLQDITPEDALKEGIDIDSDFADLCQNILDNCGEHSHDVEKNSAEIACFRKLWDSINGKPRKDGVDISWFANPLVFVISFERIGKDNK